ncbi:MAG: HEPN domain-containing protein [bacterium]
MPSRHEDWMRQAKRDLSHARNALADADYEWSCFAAQQAAEKAVKAVFQKLHAEAWGHSITALLAKLAESSEVPKNLLDKAKELDKHYIPTRYPNGFDLGAPLDYYTEKEAKRSIANARDILKFCEDILSE